MVRRKEGARWRQANVKNKSLSEEEMLRKEQELKTLNQKILEKIAAALTLGVMSVMFSMMFGLALKLLKITTHDMGVLCFVLNQAYLIYMFVNNANVAREESKSTTSSKAKKKNDLSFAEQMQHKLTSLSAFQKATLACQLIPILVLFATPRRDYSGAVKVILFQVTLKAAAMLFYKETVEIFY